MGTGRSAIKRETDQPDCQSGPRQALGELCVRDLRCPRGDGGEKFEVNFAQVSQSSSLQGPFLELL